VFKGVTMGGSKAAKEHISSMSSCRADAKPQEMYLKRSQRLQIVGKYNYDQHEGNLASGHQDEVMAIGMMIVDIGRNALPVPA
jgi:hypothetical protein